VTTPSRTETSDEEFDAYLKRLAGLSSDSKRKRLAQIDASEKRRCAAAEERLSEIPSHGYKFGDADFNPDDVTVYNPAYGSVCPSERWMKGKVM